MSPRSEGRPRGLLVLLGVTSQFGTGLILAYLRLRHGLVTAMVAHFLWNAVAVGLAQVG